MLLLLTIQADCYTQQFEIPQSENTEENVYFSLSQRGIQRYAEMNLDKAFISLLNKDLGNVSLKLMSFQFQLNNMRITEMQNPVVNILLLPKTNQGDCRLSNLKLVLHFEFVVQHNVFPYFHDSGNGKLLLSVSNIRFLVRASQSTQCPGQLHMDAEQSNCNIDDLDINFNSNLSYLYNAVMPMVSSYLLKLFDEKLSDTLVDLLIDVGNDQLNVLQPVGLLSYSTLLIYDQRWIGEVHVIDRQFCIPTSGVMCLRHSEIDICYEKPRKPVLQRALFVSNADITYEISRNVFNSALEYVWETNRSYIVENLGIEDLRLEATRIVNTGLVFSIKYLREGQQRQFEAIGPLVPSQLEFDSLVVARFTPTLKMVVSMHNEEYDIANRLNGQINALISDYAFAVENGFNIDLAHATVVYLPDNWVAVCADVVNGLN